MIGEKEAFTNSPIVREESVSGDVFSMFDSDQPEIKDTEPKKKEKEPSIIIEY